MHVEYRFHKRISPRAGPPAGRPDYPTLKPGLFFWSGCRHKPLVVETEEQHVLESPHPHDRGVDESHVIDFPGAESIQVHYSTANSILLYYVAYVQ